MILPITRRTQHILFIFTATLICAVFIYLSIFQNMHYLTDENGWLENLQVATLTLAMLIFAQRAWGFKPRKQNLCAFFAVLMFIFIMREVDFDKFNIPHWLIFLLAEQGRAIFYIAGFGLLFYEAAHWRFYWKARHACFCSSFFGILLLAHGC